jgi:hypothetical protein
VSDRKGLQLDEDIHQQSQTWVIERISWVLMALVIVAALAGLIGHGPYSSRRESAADSGFVIEYQRFEHHQAQSSFTVQLTEEVAQDQAVRLHIGQEFLREAEIDRIEPEPDSVELDTNFVTYSFNTTAPGAITFHFVPTGFGSTTLDIGVEGRVLQSYPLFFYP